MTEAPWFRHLFEALIAYRKASAFEDLLSPWVEKGQAAVQEMARFKTCSQFDSSNEAQQEAMWNLYALSRVNDLLLESFQAKEVTGGKNHIVREIAEQSTLYFTYRRKNRSTNDLSMGWGGNSQWRTDFRRDYQSDDLLVYNADGENNLTLESQSNEDRDGLSRMERIELCKNRCFVVTCKDHEVLWPFDDRFKEITPTTDWS